jgi:glycosyltransferase involved in cell wall biosynthesis
MAIYPVKILLTVHQFVPDYTSGTEVLAFSVAKELLRRGHQVFVFTGFPAQHLAEPILSYDSRLDRYEIEGISVYRYYHALQPTADQPIVTEIEYDNHLATRFFSEIVQEVQPDIIHFFHLSRLGTGLIDVANAQEILAYSTPTDFWTFCLTSQLLLDDGSPCQGPSMTSGNCVKHIAMLTQGPRAKKYLPMIPTPLVDVALTLTKSFLPSLHPLGYEIQALVNRRAFNVTRVNTLKTIFSPNQWMTQMLIRNGVNAGLIRQSAFGIDIAGYESESQKRTGVAQTIGFVGTLLPHKGCHILIQAFKQLNLPNLRLKIYGNYNQPPDYSPEYCAELQALADNSEAIEFCGTFPNTQIAAVLNGLDVLVVPSLWFENTPLVVYSAFAAHCPVVASDFPGMSEVVLHEQNGLVFPAGDIDALAEHLRSLATEPHLLANLSAGCKPPKSIAAYVDELESTYQADLTSKT